MIQNTTSTPETSKIPYSVTNEINFQSGQTVGSEKMSKTKKHFVKHDRKMPLTKPLFDPDPCDETLDNGTYTTNHTNENKSDKDALSVDLIEHKVENDASKFKRKRFSRKLTPTPDAMMINPSTDSSLIAPVETEIPNHQSFSAISDDDKIKLDDGMLITPDKFSSSTAESCSEIKLSTTDKNDTTTVDSDVVELRLKPPQKPPRTFDSLILGSSQSFESLSNLDTNSNELGTKLDSKGDDTQNFDKSLKSVQNTYSDQTEGHDRKAKVKTRAKDIKIGHDVQKDSDSLQCKSSSISNNAEEAERYTTSGELPGNNSTLINDKSSSVKASDIGLSQNIILGDSGTNDTNTIGNGSKNVAHNSDTNMNKADPSQIMHGQKELEKVSRKKEKKHKKHKKEKKNKRKEKEDQKEKNVQESEESIIQNVSVLSLADHNHDVKTKPKLSNQCVEASDEILDAKRENNDNSLTTAENGHGSSHQLPKLIDGRKTKSRWKTLRSIFKFGKAVQYGLKTSTNELDSKDEEQVKTNSSSSCSSNLTCIKNGSPPAFYDPNSCQGKIYTQCCDNVQHKSNSPSGLSMSSNVVKKNMSSATYKSITDSNRTKYELDLDTSMMMTSKDTSSCDINEWVYINDVLVRVTTFVN